MRGIGCRGHVRTPNGYACRARPFLDVDTRDHPVPRTQIRNPVSYAWLARPLSGNSSTGSSSSSSHTHLKGVGTGNCTPTSDSSVGAFSFAGRLGMAPDGSWSYFPVSPRPFETTSLSEMDLRSCASPPARMSGSMVDAGATSSLP